MGYSLSQKSRNLLATVNPDLGKVVARALDYTTQDFSVLEGARSQQRQWELYAHGRTVAELRAVGAPGYIVAAPGPKVTWVTKSNHRPDPVTGLGNAIDVVPYPIDFNTKSKYMAIKDAMFKAAAELGIKIRWGGDWDCDGEPCEKGETDIGHYEIKR